MRGVVASVLALPCYRRPLSSPTVRLSDRLSVAPLPRRRHPGRLRPENLGERAPPEPCLLTLCLPLQGFQHLLRGDRALVPAYADCVVYDAGHGRDHRPPLPLA